jgi:hypothetical protein
MKTITLHADSPMIDLSARFLKEDIRSPEAIHFVFPLDLPAHWRAHFDTAGIPTETDAEQIPGSCREWVTAETFASPTSAQRSTAPTRRWSRSAILTGRKNRPPSRDPRMTAWSKSKQVPNNGIVFIRELKLILPDESEKSPLENN